MGVDLRISICLVYCSSLRFQCLKLVRLWCSNLMRFGFMIFELQIVIFDAYSAFCLCFAWIAVLFLLLFKLSIFLISKMFTFVAVTVLSNLYCRLAGSWR